MLKAVKEENSTFIEKNNNWENPWTSQKRYMEAETVEQIFKKERKRQKRI